MLQNYVKFRRGTSEDYKRIRKDEDTLYFVYDEDEDSVSLYLGSRLITCSKGSGENSGVNNLSELKDVLLTDLKDKDLLTYNNSNHTWENYSFNDLVNEISSKFDTFTEVDENNFTVVNGKLTLSKVETSQVSNLQEILNNKVDVVEGSRLINQEEIALLQAIKTEDKAFIKSVNTDVFNVTEGKLNLVNVPESAMQKTVGSLKDLIGYNEGTTIVNEINNLYSIVEWKNISDEF